MNHDAAHAWFGRAGSLSWATTTALDADARARLQGCQKVTDFCLAALESALQLLR